MRPGWFRKEKPRVSGGPRPKKRQRGRRARKAGLFMDSGSPEAASLGLHPQAAINSEVMDSVWLLHGEGCGLRPGVAAGRWRFGGGWSDAWLKAGLSVECSRAKGCEWRSPERTCLDGGALY